MNRDKIREGWRTRLVRSDHNNPRSDKAVPGFLRGLGLETHRTDNEHKNCDDAEFGKNVLFTSFHSLSLFG